MEYIIILVIIIFLLLMLYIDKNVLTVSKYYVNSEKIPEEFNNFKIVQLSDLHSKVFGKNNKRLVRKIEKIDPDIIVMTGDMICKKSCNYYKIVELIEILNKKYKVYYSFGNHEMAQKYNNLKRLKDELKNVGTYMLYDEHVDIIKNNQKIRLYGLNFRFNMEQENITDTKYVNILKSAIGEYDKKIFNILLTHDPLNYELYDLYGSDLVLSGHVHGGIIRLFGKGIISPRRKFFPKYSAGKYIGKNGCMIVSRGLGDSGIRIRLFNFPDIVQIVLKK